MRSPSSAALERSGLQADTLSTLPFRTKLPRAGAGGGGWGSSRLLTAWALTGNHHTGFSPFQGGHEQRYETPKLQVFILPWNTSSPGKMLKDSFPLKNYLTEELTLGPCCLTSRLWQAHFHFKFPHFNDYYTS